MVGHLPALIVGQRQAHLGVQPLEHTDKAIGRAGGGGPIKLHQHRKERLALAARAVRSRGGTSRSA